MIVGLILFVGLVLVGGIAYLSYLSKKKRRLGFATMARQLGKSWLLRELLLWRIHQGDRFGEPQDVLHTGKDLADAGVNGIPVGWLLQGLKPSNHQAIAVDTVRYVGEAVAVVVADSAGPRRLKSCMASLRRQTYAAMDIVVAQAGGNSTLSDACNRAIASAKADIVALIDSRCTLHAPDALQSLVARARLPEAGAIGVKLLSKRGRIVGSAQLLGADGAYVALASQTRAHRSGYFGRARLPQHVTALGEGCVVVRTDHLRHAGWLDASYRDMDAAIVDFTFRLNAYGRCNQWVPMIEATLVPRHWRARRVAAIDAERVSKRWGFAALRDAHYNDNLGTSGRFHFASPPRVSLARPWFEPG